LTEQNRSQRVRKSLADARLVEISPEEFPDRIREVKQVAIGHLGKLLETDAGLREPRSVAQSLGTLSRLEATLRTEAQTKRGSQSGPATHPQVRDEKKR
jgi:hypothetical protein